MTSAEGRDVDRQICAMIEVVGTVASAVSRLSGRVDRLAAESQQRTGDEPAPWISAAPEAAPDDDPRTVVACFVAFYNQTFVGVDGGRAKPIPPCWREHPGLAADIAALAYGWRSANIGPAANIRESQYWLHQWRPGFVDRMVRDWLPADCVDGMHR